LLYEKIPLKNEPNMFLASLFIILGYSIVWVIYLY